MPRFRDAAPEGSVPGRRQILKGAGVGAAGMAALALSSPALARSRAAASQGTMPAQEPVVWRWRMIFRPTSRHWPRSWAC